MLHINTPFSAFWNSLEHVLPGPAKPILDTARVIDKISFLPAIRVGL